MQVENISLWIYYESFGVRKMYYKQLYFYILGTYTVSTNHVQ